jgi:hypothetical protein
MSQESSHATTPRNLVRVSRYMRQTFETGPHLWCIETIWEVFGLLFYYAHVVNPRLKYPELIYNTNSQKIVKVQELAIESSVLWF